MLRENQNPISNPLGNYIQRVTPFWRKLWKLGVPPKVQFFLWRACKDILPTCAALRKKASWNTPPQRFFKVNCDASLKVDGSGGIGCIVRDGKGRYLVACAKRVTSTLEVDHLEGLAAKMGAVMLKNLGCSRVIIEGDCDVVYRRLNSTSEDFSFLDNIIWNIKDVCSGFAYCSFS